MRTLAHLIYETAGKPDVGQVKTSGICYICNEPLNSGVAVSDRLTTKWTAQHDVANYASQWMCPACVWGLNERASHPDMERLFAMRSFSHIAAHGRWQVLSLRDKSVMRATLLQPPGGEWGMAICTSPLAAPHAVPFTPAGDWGYDWTISFGGDLVRNTGEFETLLRAVESMLTSGFSANQIKTGQYRPGVVAGSFNLWLSSESVIAPWRESALFSLAVFLASKE